MGDIFLCAIRDVTVHRNREKWAFLGPFFTNYEGKCGHSVVIWYGFHEFPVIMVA